VKKSVIGILCGIICVLLFVLVDTTEATELIWTPINPSFGGSPYNASWLMASAQAQNRHVEKTSSSKKEDPFEDFEYNLKRQYIYALSSKIIDEAFGEEGLLPEGQTEAHYTIGDFRIDIDGNGQLTIMITDMSTGSSTTVEVPYY
jgi:curli production assembly/transport component CsgF